MREGGDDGFPGPGSVSARLDMLADRGDDELLIEEARKILSQDPENLDAHAHLVFALVRLDRHREARPHVDFLRHNDPVSVGTHHAASFYHLAREDYWAARRHVDAGLELDPEFAPLYSNLALIHLSKLKLKQARAAIDRARELEPDDPDTVNLHIRIHAAGEASVSDAVKRLREFEKALELDANHPDLHNSIGDIYLDELDDPAQAEHHYRAALLGEPRNHHFQRDLFNAVAKRSYIYRVFSIPSRTFQYLRLLGKVILVQPWRLILLFMGFKFVMLYFGWLLLATFVFWPGGKIYEWLIISEMRRGGKTSLQGMRLWHRIRRAPLWLRFSGFLVLNLTLWVAAFSWLGVSLEDGFWFVGVFAGIHFVMVGLISAVRKLLSWRSRRRMRLE